MNGWEELFTFANVAPILSDLNGVSLAPKAYMCCELEKLHKKLLCFLFLIYTLCRNMWHDCVWQET